MCHSTTTLKRCTCATNAQELPHYRVLPLGGFETLREVEPLLDNPIRNPRQVLLLAMVSHKSGFGTIGLQYRLTL